MKEFILLNDEDLDLLLAGKEIKVSIHHNRMTTVNGYAVVYIQKEDAWRKSLELKEVGPDDLE